MPDDKRDRTMLGTMGRDFRRPRTPAAGVPVLPAPTWDDQTDPQAPLLEQVASRQRRATVGIDDVRERIGLLENGHEVLREKIHEVSLVVARGDGKLDALVQAAQAATDERIRRATADAEALKLKTTTDANVLTQKITSDATVKVAHISNRPAVITAIGILLTGIISVILSKVL